MKNPGTETIVLRDFISSDLSLRRSADMLFDHIQAVPAKKRIVIDFSQVQSITRSFAHEYITRKSECKTTIKELHVPKHVKEMLCLVQKPVHAPTPISTTVNSISLNANTVF